MILNKSYYYTLWDMGQSPTSFVREKSYKPEFPWNFTDYFEYTLSNSNMQSNLANNDAWYIEFFGPYCFTTYNLSDFIPKYVLDKIKRNECNLVLHNTGHGQHEAIENIYQEVILKFNLPFDNIIISSESADMHTAGYFISKKLNLPMVNYYLTTEFEGYYSHYAKNLAVKFNNFELKHYDKKFLCLNGYYRRHRAALITMLSGLNLLDKGLISFNIKEGGAEPEDTYNFMKEFFSQIPEVNSILDNNKDNLLKLKSILLDRPFNHGENLAVVMPEHDTYFNDTFFSVVTETNYPDFNPIHHTPELPNRVGRLLSEKIFRTIYFKHPFLIVCNPHSLKLLKELGYKTFDSLIDESYDDETDNSIRIYKIAKEIERLCNLSDEEVYNFINQAKYICEHNFEMLKTKHQFFCRELKI